VATLNLQVILGAAFFQAPVLNRNLSLSLNLRRLRHYLASIRLAHNRHFALNG